MDIRQRVTFIIAYTFWWNNSTLKSIMITYFDIMYYYSDIVKLFSTWFWSSLKALFVIEIIFWSKFLQHYVSNVKIIILPGYFARSVSFNFINYLKVENSNYIILLYYTFQQKWIFDEVIRSTEKLSYMTKIKIFKSLFI